MKCRSSLMSAHTPAVMVLATVLLTAAPTTAERLAAGDGLLALDLDAEAGVLRELAIDGAATRAVGGVEIIDHTPGQPVEDASLPESLRGLYLPDGALDALHTVYEADDAPVRKLSLGWLGGDRYLWRLELTRALGKDEILSLYLDADHDPGTGRQDFEGVELMLQVGPSSQRPIYYMADGLGAAARPVRARVDENIVHLTYDYPLKATDDGVACRVCVAAPDGRTPMIEVATALGRAQRVDLARARTSEAEPDGIRWERTSTDGKLTMAEQIVPHERYLSWKVSVSNQAEERRWLDLRLALPVFFEADWSFFDSFNLRPHQSPAADTTYSSASAVFPLTCAYAERGLALALNPWTLFSELHSGVRVRPGSKALLMGSRIVVDPGASEELEFVLFGFDGSLGWRGAISKYWELFPEAFERDRDIDPRFHMTSPGGLYWSFSDPESPEFSPDLIRRLRGGWTWGYAPAPRPGEWAVTERSVGDWTRSHGTVEKSLSAERLAEVQAAVREKADGDKADVAVAYYMHLKYVEQGLVNKYFSDALFNDERQEYYGYYQFVPCYLVYPWANSYGDYLEEAIPLIASRFNPAGYAFDSVFGFIPHHGSSALRSPGRSFVNGRVFVCEGIGFAKQMDLVRQQHTRGHRTGMVTNLKLPTLIANAVRSDTALLEFHPTGNPGFLERTARLRLLAGRKMMVWWHSYEPKYFGWIPWEELDEKQSLDAFRRLRDDLLIHSMYYGALPNGRFLTGVPKLIRAVPMITEMADLGWEPVIAARPAASDLLVSRYGGGLGMCYGLGNQGYEEIGDTLVVDRALLGENDLAFVGCESAAGTTSWSEGQARADVSVPARDVRALRAVLSLPRGTAEQVTAARLMAAAMGWYWAWPWARDPASHQTYGGTYLPPYVRGKLEFTISCPRSLEAKLRSWLPAGAVEAKMSLGERELTAETGDGWIEASVDLAAGENSLTVSWSPKIARCPDQYYTLGRFPYVREGEPNCEIVATEAGREPAKRIAHFFREYYLHAAKEPAEVKIPIVSPAEATHERRIWVGLRSELADEREVWFGAAKAAFRATGDTVYVVAEEPELLDEAVKALLYTLDETYVYWGPFSARRYFFRGEPADEDPAVIKAGIAGGLLEGPDTGSLPDRDRLPTLPVFE